MDASIGVLNLLFEELEIQQMREIVQTPQSSLPRSTTEVEGLLRAPDEKYSGQLSTDLVRVDVRVGGNDERPDVHRANGIGWAKRPQHLPRPRCQLDSCKGQRRPLVLGHEQRRPV